MRPLTAAYQAASSDHQVKKRIHYFLWLFIDHSLLFQMRRYVILKGQLRNQYCKKKKEKKKVLHVDNWLLSVNMIVLAALTLGFILWHFAHAALIHVSTPLKYSPMMSHKFFDSVA